MGVQNLVAFDNIVVIKRPSILCIYLRLVQSCANNTNYSSLLCYLNINHVANNLLPVQKFWNTECTKRQTCKSIYETTEFCPNLLKPAKTYNKFLVSAETLDHILLTPDLQMQLNQEMQGISGTFSFK